ncbi:MAG: hypothetical protein AAB437_01240 [Patescibacteria group bacterium]
MKILKIIFVALLIFFGGLFFGKNLINNQAPSTINIIKQEAAPSPTQTTFPPLKTLKVNGFDFGFNYQPTWQILADELIKEENGFSKKSIAINLDKPHIIGNFGFVADIMIVDYLPLPEKESLINIDDFIKTVAKQEINRSSFYNKNSLQIIKIEDKDELRDVNIASYYFQYKDSNAKNHFAYLYSLILNNDAVLKAIDIVINSLKIN